MQVLLGLAYCTEGETDNVLAALSAGTQLTGLQLYLKDSTQEMDMPGIDEDHLGSLENIALEGYIKKLPQLQLLHVSGLESWRSDAVHFTELTALTNLKFADCRGRLDFAIAAILQRLTGLRKLHLYSLGLSSPCIWASVADLTKLQHLEVVCCSCIAHTDDTLHLLAPLTNLTHLELDQIEVEDPQEQDPQDILSTYEINRLLQQLPLLEGITWI